MPRLLQTLFFLVVIPVGVWGCETTKTDRQSPTPDSSKPGQRQTPKPDPEPELGAGRYVYDHSIGSKGDDPGQFDQPVGLAVDTQGMLYVSDAGNKRLQKLDSEGKSLAVWAEGIERPMHLGWSNDDQLITAVFVDDRIELFAGTKRAAGFGGDWLDAPASAAQSKDGRFYVADFYNHQFHIVSPNGERMKSIGEKGEQDGQFTYPTDVALDPEGNVWIADAYAHRLQAFDPSGEHIKTIGGWGKEPGKFRVATGIDIGPDGRIFVADFTNNRVQVLNPDGTPLAVLGADATGDGAMKMPTEVVVTQDGVYIVDHGHHQIDVWSARSD
jgi:DNA-binding beta-propeller fold protein YncE